MENPTILKTQLVHFGPIREVIVSPDGNYLLSVGEEDGILIVVSLTTLEPSDDFTLASISDFRIRSISCIPTLNSFAFSDEGKDIMKVGWPECTDIQKIYTSDTITELITVSSNGEYLAFTGEDPQITIINLTNPGSEPISLYDNTSKVIYLQFSPDSKTLVSINETGELYAYRGEEFDNVQSENIKAIRQAICWSPDSYLIVSDASSNSIVHVFNFSEDYKSVMKVPKHSLPITACSVSNTSLMSTIDSSFNVVVSRLNKYIDNNEISLVATFHIALESSINVILWVNNNICIGTDDGNYSILSPIDSESLNEIPEYEQIEESEKELESSSDEIPLKKHPTLITKPLKKSKPQLKFDEEEEEEEEEYEVHKKRKGIYAFAMDEAEETDETSSSELHEYASANKNVKTNEEINRPKRNSEEMFQMLAKKYANEEIDDEEQEEYSTTPSTTSEDESEDEEMKENEKREKKLDKAFIVGSDQSVDEDEEDEEEENLEKMYHFDSDYDEDKDELHQMMPGSTSTFVNKRRFLCWNLIGTIFLRENVDEGSSIDIEFADTTKYKDQHFENRDNFILGSLSTGGIVLASRTYVWFKSFLSWANDNEFSTRFPDNETIDLIACGEDWFAIATEAPRLHLYMSSGLEIAIIPVASRLTSMIGAGELLAIVYGEYSDFKLFNVKHRKVVAEGNLPIRKPLKWIGFDQTTLYVLGNDNQLYGLIFNFGSQWVPLCDVQIKLENEKDSFWAVGVGKSNLWGVFLNENEESPLTVSHQKLKGLLIEPLTIDDTAKDYLYRKMEYCNATDKGAAAMKMDKELLKLFASAQEIDDHEKMYQIGLQMKSDKGKMFAIQYAKSKDVDDVADNLAQFYAENLQESDEESEEQQGDNETPKENENSVDEDYHKNENEDSVNEETHPKESENEDSVGEDSNLKENDDNQLAIENDSVDEETQTKEANNNEDSVDEDEDSIEE
ncbi:WD repeat and HMG-box DNA-binding protein 1 [Histomonas meleagridis]|uniref:WD repeat and HMG-box DNA-binding protein 1 n=1 Tax=Histomonas meleagridis TaxID=135588 RepID=UPI003559D317|nr:WD repeat and HMG-box DNA-binding protein 1 [Histomonas meleagridis]KAH0804912.1 WD repeat and HMG-box DNA-binding protein 1 [Histomonas meleagridis]